MKITVADIQQKLLMISECGERQNGNNSDERELWCSYVTN